MTENNDFDDNIFIFMCSWMFSFLMFYLMITAIMMCVNCFKLYEVFVYPIIPAALLSPIFGVIYTINNYYRE